jgi:transcriptional regulator with XRE-family HTH domain
MMQKPPYPNRLRILVKEAGLTIREVHRETDIPEGTLRWWASGNGVIPKEERVVLAQFIGCDIHDLAPIHEEEPKIGTHNTQTGPEERIVVGKMYGKEINSSQTSYSLETLASQNALHLIELAGVDCFAVDDLITLTQSNAFMGWNRDEIYLTKLSTPLPVPEDIETLRQEKLPVIQKNFINSSHYRLAAFTPAFSDRRGLEVTVAPIGFHDFYTLIPFLDEPLLPSSNGTTISLREKYGHTAFTYTSGNTCPVPAPVALHCVIVTKDHQIILMQRSNSVVFYPNHWSASFEETMDSPGMSPKGNKRPGDADFFACAIRGIEEELGVTTEAIDSIKVLSLNIEYLILATAIVAIIRTHLTSKEVKSHWLIQAHDRNEASKFATVSTDPSVVLQKLFSSNMLWHPTARMRLMQFLFHTYGVKEVAALLKVKKPS